MQKVILALLLSFNSVVAFAQTRSLQLDSPSPNQEILVGSELPVSLRVFNRDNVVRTVVASVEIRNQVTGTLVYSSRDTLYDVIAGGELDTSLSPYQTSTTALTQLGRFIVTSSVLALDSSRAVIKNWPFADTVTRRLFAFRRGTVRLRELGDQPSVISGVIIPNQFSWASLGATVVDGDSETYDPLDTTQGATLHKPVIRLDRLDETGNVYAGSGVGDTLSSWPIDAKGSSKVVLSFDYQRGGKPNPSDAAGELGFGPERTTVNASGATVITGDSLILEFQHPGEPAANGARWDRIFAIAGGRDFENKSVELLFDSSRLAVYQEGSRRFTSLDDAPTRTIANYLDSNFRFRLRVQASSNALQDDADAFYLDNITLDRPNVEELEPVWVRVVTPYTRLPKKATAHLPVYARVKNFENSTAASSLYADVTISDTFGNLYYSEAQALPQFAYSDTVLRFPDWDASLAVQASNAFVAELTVPAAGLHFNDVLTTTSRFYINVDTSNEFAYDRGTNDVPLRTGVAGDGIGLNSTSGSMAMKFMLKGRDTLLGARLYFASRNQSNDAIRISLLKDDTSSWIPKDTVSLAGVQAVFDSRRGGHPFDSFWPYLFPHPIPLDSGTYWLSVSQLSPRSMMLGGDVSRAINTPTIADTRSPVFVPIYTDLYGTQYSPDRNSGDVSRSFAVELPAGSGAWQPWMPSTGFWPMGDASNQTYLPMIRVLMAGQSSPAAVSGEALASQDLTIYPNPTSGESTIQYYTEQDGEPVITLLDQLGRKLRSIQPGRLPAGNHQSSWDGRDSAGSIVPEGVYFIEVQSGRHRSVRQIHVMR